MLTYPTQRRLGRHLDPSASLVINFVDRKAAIAGRQVNLQSFITFDRTSIAWGEEDGGIVRSHAANVMRLERLGPESGIRMERAATNVLRYSRDLSNAAWIKTNALAVQTATGLDGEENVSLCSDLASAGTARGKWSQSIAIATTNQWHTCSIYIRQITGTKIRLYVGLAGGSSARGGYAVFDTQIGACVDNETQARVHIEPSGMGFQRLVVSVLNDVAATACVLELSRENDAASPIVFAADFAQMETGSRPSSPILTTSAAVTRAGERLRIDPVDEWFNPFEGTLFIDAFVQGAAEYDRTLIRLAGETGSLEIGIGGTTGAVSVISIVSGSPQGSATAAGYVNPPRRIRLAARYKAGDFAFCILGVQTPHDGESLSTPRVIPVTGAVDVPVYSALEIGATVGTIQLDGSVRSVVYIPFALDDARLAAAVL